MPVDGTKPPAKNPPPSPPSQPDPASPTAADGRELPIRAGVRPGAATRTVQVDYLARVEGEGALKIIVRDGQVEDVALRIFEPPRFFEAFLRGRLAAEAPDITARICGICPVAYQMSAVHAIERALGLTPSPTVRELRRLLYCGEWIESHALHVFLLHAPDFLGFPDAVTMAGKHPELVRRGLSLKKVGNDILRILGGREIHPINVRVGGFYKLPERGALLDLAERLRQARQIAVETAELTVGLSFPHYAHDYDFVSLRHPDEYPLCEGRIVAKSGLDIDARDWESHFAEEHVSHSNALHCLRIRADGSRRPYLVGPLARFNLCFDRLPASVQGLARRLGFAPPLANPFHSIVVRSLELVYACEEALRIVESYRPEGPPFVDAPPRPCVGWAATEAPRGLLYHRYNLQADGTIAEAKIVPPTSQNQTTIEADLRRLVTASLSLPQAELTRRCEGAVRNYDPCISCATHFLRLDFVEQAATGEPPVG